MALLTSAPILECAAGWLTAGIRPPIRPLERFAEEEIRLVSGVHQGKPYRVRRKPSVRLWWDQLDRAVRQLGAEREYLRFTYLGPNQFGKSLEAFSIPVLWALFELQEDVICGVPTGDIADGKWNEDLRPFIEASRYADLMPDSGKGSRGGILKAGDTIRFKHGANLTWMSFYGRDKSRAAKTTRFLVITEADGAATSEASTEEDPIGQLERRALNFDLDAVIIKESTVSTTSGPVWQDWRNAGEPRLVRACPKCRAWVCPDKEHFAGWQAADSVLEAGRRSAFHCPGCGQPWTDAERIAANADTRILYASQSIDAAGVITGERPDTDQFAIRYTDVDNPFRTSDFLGRACWRAERAPDTETTWRGIDQKHFTIPWSPPEEDETPLDFQQLMNSRMVETGPGVLPDEHPYITVGVDIRKTQIHYLIVAWRADGAGRIIQYGVLKTNYREMLERLKGGGDYDLKAIGERAADIAVRDTLRYLLDSVLPTIAGSWGGRWFDQVWIDSNWRTNVVVSVVNEARQDKRWHNPRGPKGFVVQAIVGCGAQQFDAPSYSRPTKATRDKQLIGPDSYLQREKFWKSWRVYIDVATSKAWIHERLAVPVLGDDGQLAAGALSIFTPTTGDHAELWRHITAERATTEFVQGKGIVRRWVQERQANHYLDALGYAAAAARSKACDYVEVAGISAGSVEAVTADAAAADSGGGWWFDQ